MRKRSVFDRLTGVEIPLPDKMEVIAGVAPFGERS